MGNSQPHNKTGRRVVDQKLENAKKTGVLSLCEHKLEVCPDRVFEISNLTTLDLSTNKLKTLNPKLSNLKVLKSLNVDNNRLAPGSMDVVSSLSKLKTLSANHNLLGSGAHIQGSKKKSGNATAAANKSSNENNSFPESLPAILPKGLKTLLLSNNSFSTIPKSILGDGTAALLLKFIEKLDLSSNRIENIPESIFSNLPALAELNLDDNLVSRLPSEIGKLTKLKVLSLRNNRVSMSSSQQHQALPKELWTDTLLIDLNLHGNPMTSTQLNTMVGYDVFLSRRRDVMSKDVLGGAMADLEGCGLK